MGEDPNPMVKSLWRCSALKNQESAFPHSYFDGSVARGKSMGRMSIVLYHLMILHWNCVPWYLQHLAVNIKWVLCKTTVEIDREKWFEERSYGRGSLSVFLGFCGGKKQENFEAPECLSFRVKGSLLFLCSFGVKCKYQLVRAVD